jgi:thiol-disulfide isomerase/thioredoxin
MQPFKRYFITIIFCIYVTLGFSQRFDTILLNRTVHPKLSFDRIFENDLKNMGVEKQYSELHAGDYIDSNTKFTIAIYPIADKDGNLPINNSYGFYLAPYNSDSIFVGLGIHHTVSKAGIPIIIEVGGREYSAEISANRKFIKITKHYGRHIIPDAKLYNNLLPDLKFSLLDGSQTSFSSFIHKNKFIYIEFWGTWCAGCIKSFDKLKEVNRLYSDKLFIISLDYMDDDMNKVKKVVAENNLDWIEGISTDIINREFLQNGFPDGVLFDSEGVIIERGLFPQRLNSILENIIKR